MDRGALLNPNFDGALSEKCRPVEVRSGAAMRPQAIGTDVAAAWGREELDIQSDGAVGSMNPKPLLIRQKSDAASLAWPPVFPPFIRSVSDLVGEISVLKIDPQKLGHLIRHLAAERARAVAFDPVSPIGAFYFPQRIANKRQKAVFPGTMFLAGGEDGWWCAHDFANYCDWSHSRLRPSSKYGQERLRSDLESVAIDLANDPTAAFDEPIQVGKRYRVRSGNLMGIEGVVLGEGAKRTIQVAVTMLGRGSTLEIDAALLERVE